MQVPSMLTPRKNLLSLIPISLAFAYQAEALHGSAAKKVTVAISSPCYNCCRIRTYSKMTKEHEYMLNKIFQVCFQSHNRENR